MTPPIPETSRQNEAVNKISPIHIQTITPLVNFNQVSSVNLNIPNGNNKDIKALLGAIVQCLIQLLNAMNTAPTLANNFDKVSSAQADADQMYSLIEASCNTNNDHNENWTAKLKALSTQDHSLWAVQKFLKNKRSDIPDLNCSTGTAVTEDQKANILAESILTNFTENTRPNVNNDEEDLINNTVLDESRSFFRVHTGYFSNIPKCIKAEFIASWACSQSSVVSSSQR
ncbi:hypothetical protein TNCV_4784141 [Trichonephila clavipes]|nr:hypothetical protein TNCV_4784141 [Trichonephila clavipes]